MRRWLKRCRDWLVNDFLSPRRLRRQFGQFRVRGEKANLLLDDSRIPWNADFVVIEAWLHLPIATRKKTDYSLRLSDSGIFKLESMKYDPSTDRHQLLFRIPTPKETSIVHIVWQNHSLGKLVIPMMQIEEFLGSLEMIAPTIFVRLGSQYLPARVVVSSQCKGIQCCLAIRGKTSLLPLLDIGLGIRVGPNETNEFIPVPLVPSQLFHREALICGTLLPSNKKRDCCELTWMIGERILAEQPLRFISRRQLHQSLQILETRFQLINKRGEITITKQLPSLEGISQVCPWFLVDTRENGIIGRIKMQIHLELTGVEESPLLTETVVHLGDSPKTIVGKTLSVEELSGVTSFVLRTKYGNLGTLPLSPIPQAFFSSEGSFKPAQDFPWTAIADEELFDRLNRLTEIDRNEGHP